jgi:hypothetical protein
MKTFTQIVLISLVFTIILTIVIWSGKRDEKIEIEATKYEKCVLAEYGVGPANWYETHGEYPPCPVTAQ